MVHPRRLKRNAGLGMDVGSAEVPEQRPSERGRDLEITMGKMSCPLSKMFPAQQHRCMLLVLSLSSSVAVSFKVLRGRKVEKMGRCSGTSAIPRF